MILKLIRRGNVETSGDGDDTGALDLGGQAHQANDIGPPSRVEALRLRYLNGTLRIDEYKVARRMLERLLAC